MGTERANFEKAIFLSNSKAASVDIPSLAARSPSNPRVGTFRAPNESFGVNMNRLNFASVMTLALAGALTLSTACGEDRPEVSTASGGNGGSGGAGGMAGSGGQGGNGGSEPMFDCAIDPTDVGCLESNDAVFVDAAAAAGGVGTKDSPFATIAEAVSDAKRDVYICDGTYGENVAITSGKRLIGGFACNWTKSGSKPSIRQPDDGQPAAIVVTGGQQVELWQIRVEGAMPTELGGSSIGLLTLATPLSLVDSEVFAERGADGENGADAPQDSPGAGSLGGNGQNGGCSLNNIAGGAAVTNPVCPVSMGGKGANGVLSTTQGQAGDPGTSGPANGGAGGTTGGMIAVICGTGSDGAVGGGGVVGSPATAAGYRLDATGFGAAAAGNGAPGQPGQGGGGGGSRRRTDLSASCPNGMWRTAGAGAGGSGGCGGTFGAGGFAGGASVAIVAVEAGVTLTGTMLRMGDGGLGGAGGLGQPGAAGGFGGEGGRTPGIGGLSACDGGNGGLGGVGGRGGGGVGGPSIGVAYTAGFAPTVMDTTYQLGAAGPGGDSDMGGLGEAGLSEETLELSVAMP